MVTGYSQPHSHPTPNAPLLPPRLLEAECSWGLADSGAGLSCGEEPEPSRTMVLEASQV